MWSFSADSSIRAWATSESLAILGIFPPTRSLGAAGEGLPSLTGDHDQARLQIMAEISEQTMVEEVERRLANHYADVPAERISAIVRGAYAQFEQSPIRDFVPLFVVRRARAELAEAR